MKINLSNAYNIYKKNCENSASVGDGGPKSKLLSAPVKMDTITISSDAAKKNEIGKLAHSLTTEIESSVTPQRLQALKAAVDSQSYYIETDRLVDAIMGDF